MATESFTITIGDTGGAPYGFDDTIGLPEGNLEPWPPEFSTVNGTARVRVINDYGSGTGIEISIDTDHGGYPKYTMELDEITEFRLNHAGGTLTIDTRPSPTGDLDDGSSFAVEGTTYYYFPDVAEIWTAAHLDEQYGVEFDTTAAGAPPADIVEEDFAQAVGTDGTASVDISGWAEGDLMLASVDAQHILVSGFRLAVTGQAEDPIVVQAAAGWRKTASPYNAQQWFGRTVRYSGSKTISLQVKNGISDLSCPCGLRVWRLSGVTITAYLDEQAKYGQAHVNTNVGVSDVAMAAPRVKYDRSAIFTCLINTETATPPVLDGYTSKAVTDTAPDSYVNVQYNFSVPTLSSSPFSTYKLLWDFGYRVETTWLASAIALRSAERVALAKEAKQKSPNAGIAIQQASYTSEQIAVITNGKR
jgi:hypothetical protein